MTIMTCFYSSFHVRNAVNLLIHGVRLHSLVFSVVNLHFGVFHLGYVSDRMQGSRQKTQRLRSNLHPAVPQNTVGFLVPLTRSRLNLSLDQSRRMTWSWFLPSDLVLDF